MQPGVRDPRYRPDRLHELRTVGDPPVDELICRLFSKGRIGELNALLRRLASNRDLTSLNSLKDAICTAGLTRPTQVQIVDWIEQQTAPPTEDRRLRLASQVFDEHGPVITLLLSTASLVRSFAAPVGARTMRLAYGFEADPKRRIGETGQFVLANMDPDGFSAGGMARPTILKVRLLHAAVRFLIEKHVRDQHGTTFGEWLFDAGLTDQKDEVPLPQEDQLGALMAFSYMVLEGFDRLGVPLSSSEKEAYLYHWCVVGQMLGVQQDLLPRNLAEAEQATTAIWTDRAVPGNADGLALTRSLLDMFTGESPDWFDGTVVAVIRKAIGPELSDQMGIPRQLLWDAVLDPPWRLGLLIRLAAGLFGRFFGDPVQEAARRFLTVRLNGSDHYQPAEYTIPPTLQAHWADQGLFRVRDRHLRTIGGVYRGWRWSGKRVRRGDRWTRREIQRLGRWASEKVTPVRASGAS